MLAGGSAGLRLQAGDRPPPGPARRHAARLSGWAPALSLLLHGVALAAILLLLHRPAPQAPASEQSVEIIWQQEAAEDSLVTGETP